MPSGIANMQQRPHSATPTFSNAHIQQRPHSATPTFSNAQMKVRGIMETSVIFSGFGGQGALFAGQILAYAAMESGLEVTWIPSYGPEMRGGTAHCTVIVGDEPIGSPLVQSPDYVVAMNLPSATVYEAKVKAGGLIVWDSTLVTRAPVRNDIRCIAMPANELATRLGDVRLVNVAMLGALCAATRIVSIEHVARAITSHLPERYQHLLSANLAALGEGAQWGAGSAANEADAGEELDDLQAVR